MGDRTANTFFAGNNEPYPAVGAIGNLEVNLTVHGSGFGVGTLNDSDSLSGPSVPVRDPDAIDHVVAVRDRHR